MTRKSDPLADYSGQPAPSTTWRYEKVRIRRPAGGQSHESTKSTPSPARRRVARRWRHLARADRRRGLSVRLVYRGGAEGWVEVQARGSFGRFHGSTALLDVFNEVVDGAEYSGYATGVR